MFRNRRNWKGGSSPAVLLALAVLVVLLGAWGCSEDSRRRVVLYTSTDQTEVREIIESFERETGIEVMSVFDTEAQKTTGLAMRILAEAARPQADVFWNNELSRTLLLLEKGALAPYSSPSAADIPPAWKDPSAGWAAFSWRARVIVYNTEAVSPKEAPRRLEDLCLPHWRGRVAIARPLFGTTACHAAAIANVLGEEKTLDYFRRLAANRVRLYEGNSLVRDAVANGEVLVGLTDTDDVLIGKARGMKIDMIFPDQAQGECGTLVIPNSVSLVAGAPHAAQARMLIDYLLSRAVEKAFSDPARGQFAVRTSAVPLPAGDGRMLSTGPVALPAGDTRHVKAMDVDWAAVSLNTGAFSQKVNRILSN